MVRKVIAVSMFFFASCSESDEGEGSANPGAQAVETDSEKKENAGDNQSEGETKTAEAVVPSGDSNNAEVVTVKEAKRLKDINILFTPPSGAVLTWQSEADSKWKIAHLENATPQNCDSGVDVPVTDGSALHKLTSVQVNKNIGFRICEFDENGNELKPESFISNVSIPADFSEYLSLTPSGFDKIVLSWKKAAATSYTLAIKEAAIPESCLEADGVTLTQGVSSPHTVESLPLGATIGVRVCAFNDAMESVGDLFGSIELPKEGDSTSGIGEVADGETELTQTVVVGGESLAVNLGDYKKQPDAIPGIAQTGVASSLVYPDYIFLVFLSPD